jgi:hypothetical protein
MIRRTNETAEQKAKKSIAVQNLLKGVDSSA